MTLIVPAVIPVSQEDLEEKLGKLAAIPEITEVQIDVVDGRYASPASWPYQGDRAAPSRLQAEGRMLPQAGRFRLEMDLMTVDPESAAGSWIALGATRVVIHAESTPRLGRLLEEFAVAYGHQKGFASDLLSVGLAIGPATDLALAGCSAVLPSISQCATNKDLPGCSVVLPTASKCTLNPTQAGCEVVLPPAGGNSNGDPNTTSNPTTDTIVTTSNVVVALTSPNDTTLPTSGQGSSGSGTKTAPVSESKSGAGGGDSKKDDSKKDDKKETVASQDEGAKKNDTAKKMYCN